MRQVQDVDYDLSTAAKNFDPVQITAGDQVLISVEADANITATFTVQQSDDEGINFIDLVDNTGDTVEIAITAGKAGIQAISGVMRNQFFRLITKATGTGTVNRIKWIDG